MLFLKGQGSACQTPFWWWQGQREQWCWLSLWQWWCSWWRWWCYYLPLCKPFEIWLQGRVHTVSAPRTRSPEKSNCCQRRITTPNFVATPVKAANLGNEAGNLLMVVRIQLQVVKQVVSVASIHLKQRVFLKQKIFGLVEANVKGSELLKFWSTQQIVPRFVSLCLQFDWNQTQNRFWVIAL